MKGPRATPKNMNDKIVIITGSSAGLGKQSAFELLKNGATVIFACRDEKKTMSVINECKNLPNLTNNKTSPYERAVYMPLDLCSFASVQKFVVAYKKKFKTVDILMNNAGYLATKFELTRDGLESMIQTNHYSHVMLTLLLIDNFDKDEGRIVNLSSLAHTFANYETTLKNQFPKEKDQYEKDLNGGVINKTAIYGNSKLANIYFTQYLENMFSTNPKYKHLKAYSCHPGTVDTEFSRWAYEYMLFKFVYPIIRYFLKTEFDGAQTQLHLCYEDVSKLESGSYYVDCKLTQTSKASHNKELRDFLMDETLSVLKEYWKNNSTDS